MHSEDSSLPYRSTVAAHVVAAEPVFQPGELLRGCFEVRQLLGRGGMGQVYDAHDQLLNRRVAVKVTNRGANVEHLLREARAMAAFRHPGFPEVYATGYHEGVGFVVMERLTGRSLADHLLERSEPFGVVEACEILQALADSLQVLHSANLIHRDLKPDNIMLVPSRCPVLLDFGISHLAQFVPSATIEGSPQYVAPETVTGQVSSQLAPRIDIYGLGVVGYEMLAGVAPFRGITSEHVIDNVLHGEPTPLDEYRPDLSDTLSELIMSMIGRDPASRPSHAGDIAYQLRQLGRGRVQRVRANARSGTPVRVLVVDDEQEMWKLLAYVFEDDGFELVFAEDAETAMVELERGSFDIVMTDQSLPRMNGFQLMQFIKRSHPATDVVIITGYPSKRAVITALNGGAASLIEKPFDIDEIGTTVRHLAQKHLALRNAAAS